MWAPIWRSRIGFVPREGAPLAIHFLGSDDDAALEPVQPWKSAIVVLQARARWQMVGSGVFEIGGHFIFQIRRLFGQTKRPVLASYRSRSRLVLIDELYSEKSALRQTRRFTQR